MYLTDRRRPALTPPPPPVQVAALSASLGRPIEVVQAEGAPVVLGAARPGGTLLITYHRHMYGLGEHYNSTGAAAADDGEDD